jgi:Protein of unknown function (DUF2946)
MRGARRRFVAWLAIVALIGNVLAAFAPSKASALVDDVLGHLVICTSDGAKAPQGDEDTGGRKASDHCPACRLIVQAPLAVILVVTAFAFPAPAAAIPIASSSGWPAIQVDAGAIRSRAPPLSA